MTRITATILLIGCTLLSSCALFAPKTKTAEVKKEKNKTKGNNPTAEKTAVPANTKPSPTAAVVTPSKTAVASPPVVVVTDTYVPLPSKTIESAFNSSFPTAKDVVWTKEKNLSAQYEPNSIIYRANFKIIDNKNTAIYSEKGQLLEAREQILPEQLPPAIYNAIKNQYPNVIIVSATSVKYSITKATYAAIIQTSPNAAYSEVILAENGTFMK